MIAMAASMALLASAVAPGASAAGSAGTLAGVTPDPVPLKTWYTQPAPQTSEGWEQQATPLGNGHIGAMVFGGVAGDKIQVNEKTIWSGGPGADPDYNYGIQTESADAKAALNELREILQKHATEFTETQKAHFDDNGNLITGNYSYGEDAARIAELEKQLYGDRSAYGSYQTLGDIYITDPSGNDSYTDYRRELDLRRGVATVSYRQAGVDYTREYFVSYPGNVMVMRLTASEKGALDRDITLDSIQPQKTVTGDMVNNTITMRGRPSDHDENGEEFVQQLKVTATGGSVVTIGSTSSVRGADEILIYMTAGTNYLIRYQESDPFFSDEDPLVAVEQRIAAAAQAGYDNLLEAHLQDYQALFSAMDLNLGVSTMPDKPTDELLAGYQAGYRTGTSPNTAEENRYLENLYFQFGRYLLIASSREGSLPANLQGIWAKDLSNPWSADYHANINIQMNYWLAEQTNLSECHLPMIDFINSQAFMGEKMAEYYYARPDGGDVRGWAVSVGCNAWNHIASNDTEIGFVPTAAAWMCQDIWEYYQFNQDKEFLADNFDTLLGAALFWVDNLWTDERDGSLVVNPSYSPEHGILSLGTTFDQAVVWEIFNEVILAAQELGISSPEVEEIKAAQAKLSGPQIGLGGQFMEWKDETTQDVTGDGGHRHTNHLFGLHPGNQIVAGRSEQEDEYVEAMKVTLNTRGDGGSGWSKAWKVNFWARLRDGDRAHDLLNSLIGGYDLNGTGPSTADNLFDMHAPFQIDGNFGGTAGMTEMLLQSQGEAIELLPALPSDWAEGALTGLKARGDVEVDMAWEHATLTQAVLRPGVDQALTVRGENLSTATLTDANGQKVAFEVVDQDTITFDAQAGESYTLLGMTDVEGTAQAKQALTDRIDQAQDALDAKTPTDDMYIAQANLALTEAIAAARQVLENEESGKFDYLDAADALQAALDTFQASYDLTLTLSSPDGLYPAPQMVQIANTNPLIEIRYTLDGSTPTASSPLYGGAICLPYGISHLRAAAFYQGERVGDTAEASYLVTPPTNLAQGAAATDESSQTIDGYPPANMVDGKTDTRWATTQNGALVSTLDFGKDVTFDIFTLDEFAEKDQASRTQSYTLEYWDGSRWVEGISSLTLDAGSQVVADNDLAHPNYHAYKAAAFPAITTSRVRLTTNGSQISLWEVGLYSTGETGDASFLRAYVDECEALDLAQYEQTEAFEQALEQAKALLGQSAPSYRELTAAYNALVSARAQMQPVQEPGEVTPGDVNGKDGVTAADALLALQAATQKITLEGDALQAADVDGKVGVTSADALMILQAATGKITLDGGGTTSTTSTTGSTTSSSTSPTQPPKEVTKQDLLDEMNRAVDTGKYTDLSVQAYLSIMETCRTVCEMDDATPLHYQMALQALLDAKAGLIEAPESNWVGTFSAINGEHTVLGEGRNILYADWKTIDQGSIDVSEDRDHLRLQMTIDLHSDNPDVDPATMWGELVIKLRSSDKANVQGDPESGNSEHNYGWRFLPADFGGNATTLNVSIPLDQAYNNKKGVMDWTDVQRLIVQCFLNDSCTGDMYQYTMTIRNARIVDITPVEQIQQQIRTELERTVDLDGADEQAVQAYEQARQAAQQAAEASVDSVDLYDVTKALEQLKAAIEALS